MAEQQADRRPVQQTVGHAAHYPFAQSSMAVASRHDQGGPLLVGEGDELVGPWAAVAADNLGAGDDAMPTEEHRHVLNAPAGIFQLLRCADPDHVDDR